MKITEMNTAQFAAAACELLEPVSRILDTPEIYVALDNLSKGADEKESSIAYMVRGIKAAAPALLKNRLDDVITILSVLTEKTKEDLYAQSGIETAKQIYEYMFKDVLTLNTAA